ncbi:hypothetical protein PEDI_05270 [Persicobacter diffluens]|uniref:Uncharacterized protein n=2 Tax=Persicobacter diffluens TaxID=981 RepID=A0AAN4VX69_9BACT|nr:hypothetical protein PEDI_05270 [Persicobacter diffluens]
MNAGLRFEYTDQELELENTDYQNIFDPEREGERFMKPADRTVSLFDAGLSIGRRSAIVLSGSRRINRPPTKNMAPFLWRTIYEVYELVTRLCSRSTSTISRLLIPGIWL